MFLLRVFVVIVVFPAIVLAELTDFYLEVDPRDGAISDNFELSVVLEGPSANGSVAPQLKGGDFKVSFVGPRSETMIVNGDVTRRMIYVYKITPTKSGTLTTPSAAIAVEGSEYVANALSVNVSRTPAKVSGVNFEQYVDNPEPYVGEQIVYSIEVSTNASLYELRLDDTPFDGFWGEPFKDETRTSRQINGSRYAVSGTKRSLYPMREGVLPLPERMLKAKMRERSAAQSPFGPFNPFDDGFLNPLGSRMVERSFVADKTEVRVKPLPSVPDNLSKDAFKFGIVGETELSSKLSNPKTTVGEPITFEITLKSLGNLRPVQLELPVDSGLKVYPEKPRVNLQLINGKHSMEKVFGFSLVPKRAGRFTIPAVSIGYFDPRSGSYKILSTSESRIEVTGAAVETQTEEVIENTRQQATERPPEEAPAKLPIMELAPSAAQSLSPWWMALPLAIGLFLGRFLRGTRRKPRSLTEARSLNELDQLFMSQLNSILQLEPPASKWGLRAALMRELQGARELAAEAIGVLDAIDSALYGGDSKVSVKELATRAHACATKLSETRFVSATARIK